MIRPSAALIGLAVLAVFGGSGGGTIAHAQFGGGGIGGMGQGGPPGLPFVSQSDLSKEDQVYMRRWNLLSQEIQVMEAEVAIKRAELQKIEAEHRRQAAKARIKALDGQVGSKPLGAALKPDTQEGNKPGPLNGEDAKPKPGAKPETLNGEKADPDAKTAAIFETLELTVPMPFPDPTPFEDVIRYVRTATKLRPGLPEGIPFVVDPMALQKADRTMTSAVMISNQNVPLWISLRQITKQLQLSFGVRDGLLVISDKESTPLPDRFQIRERDSLRVKTTLVREALAKNLDVRFPEATPFEDVIRHLKARSVIAELPSGLPIYIDPKGLQAAEKTMMSPVTLDLRGVRLETALAKLLEPMGLGYFVKDGLVGITSKKEIDEAAEAKRP